jgi:hypothetical protein
MIADPAYQGGRLVELPSIIRIVTSLEFYRLGW